MSGHYFTVSQKSLPVEDCVQASLHTAMGTKKPTVILSRENYQTLNAAGPPENLESDTHNPISTFQFLHLMFLSCFC